MRKLLLLWLFLAVSGWAQEQPVKITLLQLNDVYTIAPVDKGGANGGFDRVETLRQRVLKDNPNTVFVMGGDTLSPSVASNLFKGAQMIEGWNAIHLDVAVLGNHEFDFGDEVLIERMKESKFVWLASNVKSKKTGQMFAGMPSSLIKEIGGVKVGFFGLLTPETLQASRASADVDITDPVACAKSMVSELRGKGCTVVVALTHLNLNEDVAVASQVDGIDVICGGHEHTLLGGMANRTPIFKWGSDARLFGRIDLTVQRGKVQNIEWFGLPISKDVPSDPVVAALIKTYEDKLNQALGQPIGRTEVDLNALQIDNRNVETNLGDFIADAYRKALGADVAFLNGGSIRSNQTIPAGTLTRRDVMTILPFENPVVMVEVPGKILRQAMEHGLELVGSAPEAGQFPQVSGMVIKYDARKPPGSRIVEFLVGKEPLQDDKLYTLASNTFVLGGGDGYTMLIGAKELVKAEGGPVEPVAVIKAIEAARAIAPRVEGRILRLDGGR
jgi:5'-nucleotidase